MQDKRTFLRAAGTVLLASQLPRLAQAQNFPAKPIRIVVPNGPGGGADLTARIVAQKISGPLGQNVIIENKPGAGGVVAGQMVARAEPDGYTLLLVSSGTAVSQALFQSQPFDALKDFAPVATMATFDLAICVGQSSKFKTLAELLAYARANPGKLNMGTPQVGTTQNLAAELFKSTAGVDIQIVPFNGTPPAITALRGGQIDAVLDIVGPLMGQIASKDLLPLAVLGAQRAPQLPAVPTARESGGKLAQFDASSWNGLAAPARTPPAVIERLSREVQAVLAQPDVQKQLLDLNLVAQGSTPEQLKQRLAQDITRWSDVIERAHIPKQ